MALDYDELFPGRFMKAGEFKGREYTLTIAGVRTEDLPQDKGGDRTRGIVSFAKAKKELVLNRTNGECLKAMFGRSVDEWVGKRVTLYPTTIYDSFTRTQIPAIRVLGSPDIPKDIVFEMRLPKKKPIKTTLKKTGTRQAAPMPAPEPEPTADDAPPPEFYDEQDRH